MPDDRFDVAILGGGPAGATAAILLGRRGYSVALIDKAKFPRPATCAGWVSAKVEPFLEELGIPPSAILTNPFREVTLHSADFAKTARPRFEKPVGFLVDREAFDNVLVDTAVQHGAVLFQGYAATEVRLGESSITVALDNQQKVLGRLMLFAAGRGSELVERVGLPRNTGGIPLWTAQVEAPLPANFAASEPRVGVVLGLDGGGSFGLCCVGGRRVVVNINWSGERERALPMLQTVCKVALQHHVVPVDLSQQAATTRAVLTPAAAALDMDTHVGKHTLLIGDAGGFVSAASNEGIYPAMWSAKLAVKAIEAALQTELSQDQLMSFDSLWRTQMADHLRSPHTDIRFLLPLIFQNQPMADRMGAAFFFGENL
jgi:flavin-dependent dehydrogenase